MTPAFHLGADALLHGGDELPRDRPADHLVDELEATALGQRLDLDVAHGELPMAAGLLHVAPVPLGHPAERLAQRHPQRHRVHGDAIARPEPVEQDVDVRLAHAPQDQLMRLRVEVEAQGGVLGDEALQTLRQLVVIGLGVRHDRHRQQRVGHQPGLDQQRVLLGGQRVAGLRPGELGDGHDVTGDHLATPAAAACPRAPRGRRSARPRHGPRVPGRPCRARSRARSRPGRKVPLNTRTRESRPT